MDAGNVMPILLVFLFGAGLSIAAGLILLQHVWVRVESGRVVRAYAWAGRTLWHEGERTRAERELGLECRDYCASDEDSTFGEWDAMASNVDRVPLLAARWSLDPAGID